MASEGEITEPANIHEAIVAVYEKIGYVPKRGEIASGSLRYNFAGEADFIAAIRPEMIIAGIYQYPESMLVLSNDRLETRRVGTNGQEFISYQFRVVVQVGYRFTHAPSGTSILVPAFGEGMDSGDKALNKAMTGANKYALRQTFMIETGDDPDKYASHPEGGVETGESVRNNNAKPKSSSKETTAPKDSKPKADDKPAAEPPKKLSVDAINEFSAKIPTCTLENCEKAETWINAQGIANKIDRVIWGDLQHKLLCRWIELLAPDATLRAIIANKIPPLAGMGLFTVEQRADLATRLTASE